MISTFCRRNVSYAEFSQFLHDFHDEYATVGFIAKDADQKGIHLQNNKYRTKTINYCTSTKNAHVLISTHLLSTGYISASDFYDILVSIKSHLLTDPVSIIEKKNVIHGLITP